MAGPECVFRIQAGSESVSNEYGFETLPVLIKMGLKILNVVPLGITDLHSNIIVADHLDQ